MKFLLFLMHNGLAMLERNFFLSVCVRAAKAHTHCVDASVYLSLFNIRVSSHTSNYHKYHI